MAFDAPVLAAYALWRLNWIHPFLEGNGRTARAACYYLICLKYGGLLPGKKIVPERIREHRPPYYAGPKPSGPATAADPWSRIAVPRHPLDLAIRQRLAILGYR